jgi:hypothetical protein
MAHNLIFIFLNIIIFIRQINHMKHYKLILAAFSIAILFSSCQQKEYECWCVDDICGVIYPIEAKTKKKAQAECDVHQSQAGTGVCTLEIDEAN